MRDCSRDCNCMFCSFDPDHDWLVMNGYDDCIIGVVEQYGRPPIVCYDKPKVLAKLVSDGMSEEEAEEFWSFNQIGAYMGENTPCFLTPKKYIKSEESPKSSLSTSDKCGGA